MICHGALSRFPELKLAVIENGSSWVEPLLENLADIYKKMPQDFPEDPIAVFKRNVYISPFWEEDLGALAELIGVDHVLFGSDYPHPEGLADPPSYVDELAGLPDETIRKIMGGNLARLMNVEGRSPAMTDRRGRSRQHPGDARAPRPSASAIALAVIDGDTQLHLRRSCSTRPTRSAPPWSALGIEPGDRVSIWAPNSAEWIVAALGIFRAGAVLVPVNTRFKGARGGRDPVAAAAPGLLVTVTDFLGVDHVAHARRAPRRAPGARDRRRGRAVRTGPAPRRGTAFARPGHRRRPGRGRSSQRGARPRRRRRTSSSRRAPPAARRAWCRPTAGRCGWPPTGWR